MSPRPWQVIRPNNPSPLQYYADYRAQRLARILSMLNPGVFIAEPTHPKPNRCEKVAYEGGRKVEK